MLYPAAAMSLFAALVHLWATPEHLSEVWGYGAFFLGVALAQGVYAAVLLRRPSRRLLLAGIIGNSSIVLLYLATRALGVPPVGPEAGEVEAVGLIDACATASEVVLVGALGVLLLWRLLRERLVGARPDLGRDGDPLPRLPAAPDPAPRADLARRRVAL